MLVLPVGLRLEDRTSGTMWLVLGREGVGLSILMELFFYGLLGHLARQTGCVSGGIYHDLDMGVNNCIDTA